MSLVFLDVETTGTNTAFDQILQFAAIRTDHDLKEIGRFEIRSRLLPYIVPSPGAMRVTGITVSQLVDPSLPSHYEMVRTIEKLLLSWSPAVFLGYNSIHFDEQLLRQAFYQTLHPPYLTNTNGNSRSDVMRMAQAATIFEPGTISVPTESNGRTVFALDRLAPANGFVHEHAHDAMADVEATIFLCRLLAERAPEIWSAFMRFSQKAAVTDYISNERVFCLADVYFGRPNSWLVTSIGSNSQNNSEYYVYDLGVDPSSLSSLTADQLVARLSKSPKPLRRLRSNAAPMLMAAENAPAAASGKVLESSELERRADILHSNSELRNRLITAFEATKEEREASPYVEDQLYDGFFNESDEELLNRFHDVRWEERAPLIDQFADERLKLLGQRLLFCERPDLLDKAVRQIHAKNMAQRVMEDEGTVPWLTLPKAAQEIDDLLRSANGPEAAFLKEHRAYLLERLESAAALIN
jgi:exodeoxyribonuclease-1